MIGCDRIVILGDPRERRSVREGLDRPLDRLGTRPSSRPPLGAFAANCGALGGVGCQRGAWGKPPGSGGQAAPLSRRRRGREWDKGSYGSPTNAPVARSAPPRPMRRRSRFSRLAVGARPGVRARRYAVRVPRRVLWTLWVSWRPHTPVPHPATLGVDGQALARAACAATPNLRGK